tara:strand:- start:1909 stop:2901 length:993 start_codon:yes stop_codon:yes gene_type:complete
MNSILEKFRDSDLKIEPSVTTFLSSEQRGRVLVACSGGADSVFTLILLCAHRSTLNLDISVAHFNHKWRAEASNEDCRFVQALAQRLAIPFYSENSQSQEITQTETHARSERISFLRACAAEINADAIAFGHQNDDILETQIQRLGRGSALEGLIAPRPIHYFPSYPTHIRPVLHLSSSHIEDQLKAFNIQWREDSSNEDQSIIRNKLRHTIIPLLSEAMKRNVSEGASRSRRLLEEDSDLLNTLAKERLGACFSLEPRLDRICLRNESQSLTRRAFFYWLRKLIPNQEVSATLQEKIMEAIYGERFREKFSIGEKFLVMNKREIWIDNR